MKILLVDDHLLFRAGLRMLLAPLQEDLTILECGTTAEALALVQAHPDIRLCLLDLSLRGSSGEDAINALREALLGIVIVVISADESPATVYRVLDLGVMGYIPKSVSVEIMTQALKLVLAGGIYLPSSLMEGRRQTGPAPGSETPLTARQHQVLQCLLRGWPNKLISRHLCLSENTVKTHLSAIYRHLRVTTRSQAVVAARRLGIDPLLEEPSV
jgi:DNA-binding NarL/FixJ family response regulator